MLPLAHTYVSTKVTGRQTQLLVFGGILPDISSFSTVIDRSKIHYAPREFYNYFKTHSPSLIDLAIGVRLHSHIDRGADYYCDNGKIGFAMIEGKKIINQTKALLDTGNPTGNLINAHHFIEEAVDLMLAESHPEILITYSKSINNLDLKLISKYLSEYLGLTQQTVLNELHSFISYLSPENLSSAKRVVQYLAAPLLKIRYQKEIDQALALQIIEKTKENIKDRYLGWLNNAVANMKIDFADLLHQPALES